MKSFRTLIATKELAAHLADPSLAIVDCRFNLHDDPWGGREYLARHIPGAAYAHLNRDLSGPLTGTNGRHPLPDVATLSRTLSRLGVGRGIQVVAYDQDNGMFASRLWWLLRWLGHDDVAVLDGGFAKWIAEGNPTASGEAHATAREFQPSVRPELVVTAADVSSRIGTADWRLVDARAPERYRGEIEPLDKAAGHIPGAVNRFYQRNLDERGAFRSPDDLHTEFGDLLGSLPADHLICYCGSGVTACHNLLALEHAGRPGAKLYPGSWSEWSSDPSRPVERG